MFFPVSPSRRRRACRPRRGPARSGASAAAALALTALLAAPLARAQSGVVTHEGRRYDHRLHLGAHNAYANPKEGYQSVSSNQDRSTIDQLKGGARWLNPDIWVVQQTNHDQYGTQMPYTSLVHYGEPKRVGDVAYDVDWSKVPTEIVVAHNAQGIGYLIMDNTYYTPFKSFLTWLTEVVGWLKTNPDVIAIDLENLVTSDYKPLFDDYWYGSGAEAMTFYPDRENPKLKAPLGRPGGWDVRKYGWPSEEEMVKAGYQIVFLDYAIANADDYSAQVKSTYGNPSLDPKTWTNSRDSSQIDDYKRHLFTIDHMGDLPGDVYSKHANDISVLDQKHTDMMARWARLPNFLEVDLFAVGATTNPDKISGPIEYVAKTDAIWQSLTPPTPSLTVTPMPTASGWNNTDVTLTMSAEGDRIKNYVSSVFMDGVFDRLIQHKATENTRTLSEEGAYVVSFSAIGTAGNRSDHYVTDVKIDKTLPKVEVTASEPVLSHDPTAPGMAVVQITAKASDALSGLDGLSGGYAVTDEYGEDHSTRDRIDVQSGQAVVQMFLPVALYAGDKDGRQFRITFSVLDKAGNVGAAIADVTLDFKPSKGDVNGDVTVNVSDAIMDLQFAVSIKAATAEQLAAGDIDGSGSIDVSDSVRILRYVVGLQPL